MVAQTIVAKLDRESIVAPSVRRYKSRCNGWSHHSLLWGMFACCADTTGRSSGFPRSRPMLDLISSLLTPGGAPW